MAARYRPGDTVDHATNVHPSILSFCCVHCQAIAAGMSSADQHSEQSELRPDAGAKPSEVEPETKDKDVSRREVKAAQKAQVIQTHWQQLPFLCGLVASVVCRADHT